MCYKHNQKLAVELVSAFYWNKSSNRGQIKNRVVLISLSIEIDASESWDDIQLSTVLIYIVFEIESSKNCNKTLMTFMLTGRRGRCVFYKSVVAKLQSRALYLFHLPNIEQMYPFKVAFLNSLGVGARRKLILYISECSESFSCVLSLSQGRHSHFLWAFKINFI